MKRWHSVLTHEWRAKLMSLALATLLWLFIRHSINYSPLLPSPFPVPPPPPHFVPPQGGGNQT